MPELSIIQSIARRAARQPTVAALVKGIGDDCAILRPQAGKDLVFTSDFLIEDRHFTRATYTPADIGHKALARSLSDLAAMGATPVFCLVSLAVPNELGAGFIRSFYNGLLKLAKRYGISLAGGDLAAADKVFADITCCGSVPRGKSMLRSAAKPGDLIHVTGKLGGAAHALRAGPKTHHWKRLARPKPRIEEGLQLLRAGVMACIDISDGLLLDLHRLCLASGVSAQLNDEIPRAPDVSIDEALGGGDDYELLYTAPSSLRNVPGYQIGTITAENAGRISRSGKHLKPAGFQHFSS